MSPHLIAPIGEWASLACLVPLPLSLSAAIKISPMLIHSRRARILVRARRLHRLALQYSEAAQTSTPLFWQLASRPKIMSKP
jgi:hypothetical protein